MKAHRLITSALVALLAAPLPAAFSSGSTGADGALNIGSSMTLTVQEDGVHNYTTINVAAGATLSFNPNSRNTPVVFLATGDVTINGTITLGGASGRGATDPLASAPGNEARPGPGGFPGGLGAIPVFLGGDGIASPGGCPGGGAASLVPSANPTGRGRAGNGGSLFTAGSFGLGNAEPAAPIYGDLRLIGLTGGSGGAGGNSIVTVAGNSSGGAGGAGAGGILIASSGNIIHNGALQANGGSGHGASAYGNAGSDGSGGGAGGAVRLMANQISGTGFIQALGGGGAGPGGIGHIRIETFSLQGLSNFNPSALISTPTVVGLAPGDIPTLTIASIGGVMVPAMPTGSTAMADVTIPPGTMNPVNVLVNSTNVPTGSTINLRITQENGEVVIASGPTNAMGVATIPVNLDVGFGIVYATVDFP
jgi:hypothetical protein